MGRFYSIAVAPGQTGASPATTPGGLATVGGVSTGVTWTSVVNGVFDPNALLVEFDFFSFSNASSGTDGSTVTIHGIGFQNITEANQFGGQNVIVKAGMSGGLPLESPAQAGVILNGQIFQSWANYVGTDMDLNFLVYPSKFTYEGPGNFVLNWQAGTSLQSALTTTLTTAYPNIGLIFNLSKSYILGRNVIHVCSTVHQLSDLITSTTALPNFLGVTVSTPVNNTIIVSDNLGTNTNPKQILFDDLVGQPTWVPGTGKPPSPTVLLTTVMRADIQIGSVIIMPQGAGMGGPGTVNISSSAVNPSLQNLKTAFQGQFIVTAIRQVGNSRGTGPTDWVTMFQCTPTSITQIITPTAPIPVTSNG
jgi:hypothetical protein